MYKSKTFVYRRAVLSDDVELESGLFIPGQTRKEIEEKPETFEFRHRGEDVYHIGENFVVIGEVRDYDSKN